MKKMNNKGFSLVELIVVVLIMAIIAVALAPQVMKWVENSRKSTDVTNYGHVADALEIAYAKEAVYKAGDCHIVCTAGSWGNPLANCAASYTQGAEDAAPADGAFDAADLVVGSIEQTLGTDWKNDYKMRSKRYSDTNLAVGMKDGHLVRDTYVAEDIES